VVVAVVIDQPTRGYYGGSVAAPVFREVTASALRRLGVVPTLPAKAVR
jgi:cell division protein FtsI (penicillin-binding protein 3)